MIDFDAMVTLNETFRAQQNDYLTKSRNIFYDAIEEVFAKYPALSAISWHQFTPFVNDEGEPSVFRAETDDFSIIIDGKIIVNNLRSTKHEKASTDYNTIIMENSTILADGEKRDAKKQVMQAAFEDVRNILTAFDGDFYRQLHGDFRWVILTKDGSYSEVFLPTLPKDVKIIQENSEAIKEEVNRELIGNAVAPAPIGEAVVAEAAR